MYLNHANKALKLGGISNQVTAGGKIKYQNRFPAPCQQLCVSLSTEVLCAMNKIHYALSDSNPNNLRAMYITTEHHGWVVGCISGTREFYVVLDRKLSDIGDIEGKPPFH